MGKAYRTWIILLYQSTETLALHCHLGLMFVCCKKFQPQIVLIFRAISASMFLISLFLIKKRSVAFYYAFVVHNASEAISAKFLRLRKTQVTLVMDRFEGLFYINHKFEKRTSVWVRLIFFL